MSERQTMVRCGDCRHFVRDGRCGYLDTPEGKDRARPFEHAPFWVWSDCYSDKEQVRRDVTSACPTFSAKAEASPAPAEIPNTFEIGKPAPYFCPACQAVPRAGYCKLAGCPTAPAEGDA